MTRALIIVESYFGNTRAIAEAVGGDGELLACLHLLVQADASACKEEAWDAWKAGLVDVLVHRAQAAIA